jgi:hypothetical protein
MATCPRGFLTENLCADDYVVRCSRCDLPARVQPAGRAAARRPTPRQKLPKRWVFGPQDQAFEFPSRLFSLNHTGLRASSVDSHTDSTILAPDVHRWQVPLGAQVGRLSQPASLCDHGGMPDHFLLRSQKAEVFRIIEAAGFNTADFRMNRVDSRQRPDIVSRVYPHASESYFHVRLRSGRRTAELLVTRRGSSPRRRRIRFLGASSATRSVVAGLGPGVSWRPRSLVGRQDQRQVLVAAVEQHDDDRFRPEEQAVIIERLDQLERRAGGWKMARPPEERSPTGPGERCAGGTAAR